MGVHASHAGGDDQGVRISTSLSCRTDSTLNMKRAICSLVVDTVQASLELVRRAQAVLCINVVVDSLAVNVMFVQLGYQYIL